MSLFDWFRRRNKKTALVVKEGFDAALEELKEYLRKKKDSNDGSSHVSDLDLAKEELARWLKQMIEREPANVDNDRRKVDYKSIIVAAYDINKDLEEGRLKYDVHVDIPYSVGRDTPMMDKSEVSCNDKQKNTYSPIFYKYLAKQRASERDVEMKPTLYSGSFAGLLHLTTSKLHKIIYNLFQQCPRPSVEDSPKPGRK